MDRRAPKGCWRGRVEVPPHRKTRRLLRALRNEPRQILHRGGPDFVDAPLTPYFLSYDSAVRAGTSSLLEVPISAALNRSLPQWMVRAYGRAPMPYHTKRFLRLARIVKTCWLRPSYSWREVKPRGLVTVSTRPAASNAVVVVSPSGSLSAMTRLSLS